MMMWAKCRRCKIDKLLFDFEKGEKCSSCGGVLDIITTGVIKEERS